MHITHRLFTLFFMSLLVFTASAEQKAQSRDAGQYFFHQSFNNLKDELETAQENNKKGVFIMFNDKDCPWCAKMKATIMNQVPIQDYYREHFQVLMIDTRGDNTMTNFDDKELTEKDFSFKIHRVRATPVFMFFDLTGNLVMRYTGATRNADEFKWLGEFVASGAYKTMKFSKYKREHLATHGK